MRRALFDMRPHRSTTTRPTSQPEDPMAASAACTTAATAGIAATPSASPAPCACKDISKTQQANPRITLSRSQPVPLEVARNNSSFPALYIQPRKAAVRQTSTHAYLRPPVLRLLLRTIHDLVYTCAPCAAFRLNATTQGWIGWTTGARRTNTASVSGGEHDALCVGSELQAKMHDLRCNRCRSVCLTPKNRNLFFQSWQSHTSSKERQESATGRVVVLRYYSAHNPDVFGVLSFASALTVQCGLVLSSALYSSDSIMGNPLPMGNGWRNSGARLGNGCIYSRLWAIAHGQSTNSVAVHCHCPFCMNKMHCSLQFAAVPARHAAVTMHDGKMTMFCHENVV